MHRVRLGLKEEKEEEEGEEDVAAVQYRGVKREGGRLGYPKFMQERVENWVFGETD